MAERFRKLARDISDICAAWQTFIANLGLIIVWLVCGPIFSWSDTWQLLINTGTTVISYLLIFLIMNTQSRDTKQLSLKLDALIAATDASNRMIALDDLTDEEFRTLRERFDKVAFQAEALNSN